MTQEHALFRTEEMGGGVRLHHLQTAVFKTVTARLVLHTPLDEDTAARAVVPRVLSRGTASHPSLRELQAELDRNFGTRLWGSVGKIGERQTISFNADWLLDRVAGVPLADRVTGLWQELLHRPARDEDGRIPEARILRERKGLRDEVASVYDDKGRYARRQLIELMCDGEPYARPATGRVDEVDGVGADDVRRAHRRLLERAPADLFVVGDLGWDAACAIAQGLALSSDRRPAPVPESSRREAGEVRTRIEEQAVEQAKLEMGFRVPIRMGDALYPGLTLFNVLFGGSASGRLFKVVREQNSLCYSISSAVERSKGLVWVQAGIESAKFDEARRLILDQLEELRAGRIEEEEVERARALLLNGLRSLKDSPRGLIGFALERLVNGVVPDLEAARRAVEDVSAEDAARAASTIELDAVYLLRSEPA